MKKSSQTLLDRLRSSLQQLSPAEKRVAMTLIADFPITGLKTVVEIAGAAGVSPATVSRFAETLGFSGFPEFQRALHGDVIARFSSPGALFDRLPDRSAEPGSEKTKARHLFSDLIGQTFAALDSREVEAFIAKLADPKRTICFIGGRQTGSLARYFQQLVHNLRARAVFINSVNIDAIDSLIELDAKTTLVAFDFRRYQQDTAHFVAAAATRRVQTVLITDPYMSPAVKYASQAFICHTNSDFPFDSFASVLALIDYFVQQLFVTLGDSTHARISRLESIREDFGLEYVMKS